ncbi:MAG: periplasmic heavy metal sensor [Deltaproteobacteria bacterium]|nr:periplasmic heavy metal sensor [Deltaproteobacteria bacterium]
MRKKVRVLLAALAVVFMAVSVSGCAGWWHRRHDADWVLKKMDSKIEKLELGLTDAQKMKFEAVKQKVAEYINYHKDSMGKAVKALNVEAAKETPDFNALVKTVKEINGGKRDGMDAIADSFNDFHMSLDNGQKKKFLNALKEMAEHIEKWHGK